MCVFMIALATAGSAASSDRNLTERGRALSRTDKILKSRFISKQRATFSRLSPAPLACTRPSMIGLDEETRPPKKNSSVMQSLSMSPRNVGTAGGKGVEEAKSGGTDGSCEEPVKSTTPMSRTAMLEELMRSVSVRSFLASR